MPKYLVRVSYTAQGVQGLLSEGGSARRETATGLIEDLGGRIEAFYFAFGADDAILIVDMPDTASIAAASLTVSASGAVSISTTPLITPEEIDRAAEMSPVYRPPGG